MSAGELRLVGAAEGAGEAEGGAGLVERAVGLGAAVVLGDATAVPERSGPVVALARVDLHHALILSAPPPMGLKVDSEAYFSAHRRLVSRPG